jgi:hypothetical protein
MLLQLTFHDFIFLIKLAKINCFKEDKTTFKQAKRVILAPIKKENGFKSNWTDLAFQV